MLRTTRRASDWTRQIAATQARQTWREKEMTLHRAERGATEARAALESAVQRREAAERKAR